MSLTLPVVVVILAFAVGATWTVGHEYFKLRARVRQSERDNRKIMRHLGIKPDDDEENG